MCVHSDAHTNTGTLALARARTHARTHPYTGMLSASRRTRATTHRECARTEPVQSAVLSTLRRFCGLFCTQHVFTAAQGSYTQNILDHLDPDGTIFETVLLWLYRIQRARALAREDQVTDRADLVCS
jgi:hypothetical protein